MKNFVQAGHVVNVPAPTGGVSSGNGVLVGSLFGIAATDAAQGERVEIAVSGVFRLPITGPVTVGAKAYWHAASKTATADDAEGGNAPIGHFLSAQTAGIGPVRLSG